VGDVEQQRAESASNVTLHQSSVNRDPTTSTTTSCDATATKSFSSPGVSKLVGRSRPLMPLRRSRRFERSWSPDLSCFRQPRSPDVPDEDRFARYQGTISAGDEDATSSLSRSRLLRRLLFNGGRIAESAGKLQTGLSTTDDGCAVRNFDDAAADRSTGNTPRTDRNDDADDLLLDVRRYRSLTRRGREQDSCDVEELEERCPSTPPLAVFLSSEDITSTIFPLRHAILTLPTFLHPVTPSLV